jgi:hypothetical protein
VLRLECFAIFLIAGIEAGRPHLVFQISGQHAAQLFVTVCPPGTRPLVHKCNIRHPSFSLSGGSVSKSAANLNLLRDAFDDIFERLDREIEDYKGGDNGGDINRRRWPSTRPAGPHSSPVNA